MSFQWLVLSGLLMGFVSGSHAQATQPETVGVVSEVDSPEGGQKAVSSVQKRRNSINTKNRLRETEAEGMEAPRQFQSHIQSDISLKSQYKFQGQSIEVDTD